MRELLAIRIYNSLKGNQFDFLNETQTQRYEATSVPSENIELKSIVSSLQKLIPNTNFFNQGTKKMDVENNGQLKKIIAKIQK